MTKGLFLLRREVAGGSPGDWKPICLERKMRRLDGRLMTEIALRRSCIIYGKILANA